MESEETKAEETAKSEEMQGQDESQVELKDIEDIQVAIGIMTLGIFINRSALSMNERLPEPNKLPPDVVDKTKRVIAEMMAAGEALSWVLGHDSENKLGSNFIVLMEAIKKQESDVAAKMESFGFKSPLGVFSPGSPFGEK